ncbi:MAG: DUF255 domain-containing protein [Taibaiella sp.]|nr:DUF255 domain-containing protein [Taibaiella sp.]
MKRLVLAVLGIVLMLPVLHAENKTKKSTHKHAAAAPVDDKEIHWLTWDEVQTKMKKEPRKVWVDIYTDWCGWCKKMDATTFKNPGLVRYMNEKFYAVRFNAEKQDSIMFLGKMYVIEPQYKTNKLAVDLMRGQMSYPTGIIMEENFQNPQALPGYHPVSEMEMILKFMGENTYRNQKFDEYQKVFKGNWGS